MCHQVKYAAARLLPPHGSNRQSRLYTKISGSEAVRLSAYASVHLFTSHRALFRGLDLREGLDLASHMLVAFFQQLMHPHGKLVPV